MWAMLAPQGWWTFARARVYNGRPPRKGPREMKGKETPG